MSCLFDAVWFSAPIWPKFTVFCVLHPWSAAQLEPRQPLTPGHFILSSHHSHHFLGGLWTVQVRASQAVWITTWQWSTPPCLKHRAWGAFCTRHFIKEVALRGKMFYSCFYKIQFKRQFIFRGSLQIDEQHLQLTLVACKTLMHSAASFLSSGFVCSLWQQRHCSGAGAANGAGTNVLVH